MKYLLSAILILIAAGPASAAEAKSVSSRSPYEGGASYASENAIDKLVFKDLKRLKIQPAAVCSDAVFVRRVYLDVIGTLPTSQEATNFLKDKDPDKRSKLIDRLLEDDAYADYWSLKWGDLLRVKAEFPVNLWPNAVQATHRWIHDSLKANKPYDRFARELLTSSGSNFREAPVNFYRSMPDKKPDSLARAVALLFMGTRFDKLNASQQTGMTAFFTQVNFKLTAEWKEEIVFHDPSKTATNPPSATPQAAVFPDGTKARIKNDSDPRVAFADWLITEKNPWFARSYANRCWAWLQGQGIVDEPDDFRPDNPPSNPELLDLLAAELVKSGYDTKQLFRLILNSKTYQLSSIPRSDDPRAQAHLAFYPVRRLEAEVLADALCQLSGTTEKYSSQIPEPFTFIPDDQRSILLSDGSITSPFLEMFGRPSRDTGLESERDNTPSSAQRLHLLNSSHVRDKITKGPRMKRLFKSAKQPEQMVNRLYITVLSRWPTEEEKATILAYSKDSNVKGWRIGYDVAWALINSKEFLYRH